MNNALGPTPTTADHMPETTAKAVGDRVARLSAIIIRTVAAVAKHWLFLITVVFAIEAMLPILAPVLMATSHVTAAQLIYTLYAPFCHQLPERSFFLFGPQSTYTLHELEVLVGSDVPLRYIGNPAIGFKVAACQRDTAIYLALWAASLAFIPLRRRLRPLPIKFFILLCVPMAVDGLGQLLMLWKSTSFSRVVSGTLFGIACVWLSYPYIEAGMQDVLRTLGQANSNMRTAREANVPHDAGN